MQLNWKLRLLASRVDIINIFRRGHLPLWGLVFQSYYHLKKKFISIQALLRHNEYTKANYKKKLRYLQKNLWTHFVKRDCRLQCLNDRYFITSWNFIVKF